MGFVGGYTLDLYCDGKDCPNKYLEPCQYCEHTHGECIREARNNGWIINPKGSGRERGFALCPQCSGKSISVKR